MTRFGWLLAAALLGAAETASAAPGNCHERCGQSLARCAGTCGTETKCTTRCNEQLDRCVLECTRREKPVAASLPSKCPGPNGKLVPCSDYQPPASPAAPAKAPRKRK